MEITETIKRRVVRHKHDRVIGLKCDICGKESKVKYETDIPKGWTEVEIYWDAGWGDTSKETEHVCSPECYFRSIALYAHPTQHSCAETVDGHPIEFMETLAVYIEPLFGDKELEKKP